MQIALLAAVLPAISAQEMEPRAYSPAPIGAQFVVINYAHQTGDVLFDSSLPLRDVKVKINAASFGYGRTFALAGRQANVAAIFPYLWGTVRGTVFEDQLTVRRSGGVDIRARFSMLLKGGQALRPREFGARKPGTIVGISLAVIAPTGQYDPRRLVNPGSNRWAFKPEIGVSKPKGRWTVEVTSGLWLFTANNNFFGGSHRTQKPLASFQAHAIYTLRRRMWLSADAAYYIGGQSTVNGVVNADRQKNSRLGATFSFPVNQHQSLKAAWAKGVTTRSGGDLNTIAVGWAYAWSK